MLKNNNNLKNLMFSKNSIFIFIAIISLIMFSVFGLAKPSIGNQPETAQQSVLENQTSIKFAQLTDIHISVDSQDNTKIPRMAAYSRQLFQDAVNQIKKMNNLDFVIFTGDSIDAPTKTDLDAFSKIASELKIPWYVVLGNHDIGVSGGLNKSEFFGILKKYNPYMNNDKPYYAFSPKKGFIFIVMDGDNSYKSTSNGYFPKEQLSWLEETLKNNKDSKVIIAQHFPLIEPFKSKNHRVLNAKEYLSIINRYNNVIAVISGHYHAAKLTKVRNIVHVSSPALIQFPNAFRIIDITSGSKDTKMDFKLIETNLKDIQNISRIRSKSAKLANGKELDRNSEINIKNK